MANLLSACITIGSLVAVTTIASAADMPMPVKAPPYLDQPTDQMAPFIGGDFTSQGYAFGYAGAMFAPYGSLDNSGLRLYLEGGGGVYKYFSDDDRLVRGSVTKAEFLFGYGLQGATYSINFFVGANVEDDSLSMPDPTNPVQGTQFGVMGRTDWWINPTAQTLLSGEAEYSTAFRTYWVKAQYGYDVTMGKEIFVGPEAIFQGDARYDQWRVGAHVTALHFGKVDVQFSGGYVHDSNLGSGGYGIVELYTKF